MDLWGIGCVLFEILALFPLFPGENEKDQIDKIHKVLGTPCQSVSKRYLLYNVKEMRITVYYMHLNSGPFPIQKIVSPESISFSAENRKWA